MTKAWIRIGSAAAVLIIALSVRASARGTYYMNDPNAPWVFLRADDGNPNSSSVYWCAAGTACQFCGWCHEAGTAQADPKRYSRELDLAHVRRYFPPLSSLPTENQRLSFDRGRTTFVMERGQLVVYDTRHTKMFTAPPGSKILKNKRGTPVTILFNGQPAILKRGR